MNRLTSTAKQLKWSAVLLLSALVAGCNGGDGSRAPILGGGGLVAPAPGAPTVTAVTPVNNATAVPISNPGITATFSEPMAPITGGATFTVTTAAPGTNPTGTVALDGTNRIATFTLTASTSLAPLTLYTATVTGAKSLATGLPMASPYVWRFTTGVIPDTTRPRVTLTVPATTIPGPTLGVPFNTAITATFTEDMAPATITGASFTVTGPGATAVAGGLTYAARTAVFTPAAALVANTTYTATITTVATDLAGNALGGNQAPLPAASNYVWTFTTGLTPDTTRPRVTLTVPATTIPGPTLGVATNTAISAAFTEAMNPTTISGTSFTVTGPGLTPVVGNVTYASQIAIFTPAAVLAAGTTFTATITLAATDLAGNALAGNQAPLPAASNYVWTFTTAAAIPPANISVLSTNPIAGELNVCPTAIINATFNVPSGLRMDPTTINAITFTVEGPGPLFVPVTAASVLLDVATGRIATFTPSADLTVGDTYTATIKSGNTGVKDLALPANAMLADFTWTFTVVTCGAPPPPSPLGSAAGFGIMATSAITNTGFSVVNGDVSLDPGTSMTGFPPGVVNGTIHINDTVSAQARADLLTAYNYFKALPPGTTISAGADLGALYPLGMPPGTYTSGSTMLVSTPLVLDAGGNANAIWVFQIGSSVTTGASVSLANGAQAKNVFWVPTSDATIGVGTIFYGTLVTGRDATGQTGAVINGRILAGAITAGTIALDTNTVNVPAP